MTIPFEPSLFGIKINVHLILEYLAFFIGFRYYIRLRRSSKDNISNGNRLSIILGAIVGAFIGSRLMGFLENPLIPMNTDNLLQFLNTKSIMGGLFGGLIGVELSKKIIREKQSSGDLFTFPIIVGILIGRLGCFLSGTNEFTYGKETRFFIGMDLGDGLLRHPTSLYEMLFLILLFVLLKRFSNYLEQENGLLFKVFMLAYFGFRFFIEFLKPNVFYVLGLSSIQWLCVVCWMYYLPTLNKLVRNAY
ncbi:MAG: prolipoprotein diacylglyceryl transferase family protein [Bacteroidota bacterium]|nr:prolipoprotein diacylglyceryl transferase family protein [Bacteroidota bacterium]